MIAFTESGFLSDMVHASRILPPPARSVEARCIRGVGGGDVDCLLPIVRYPIDAQRTQHAPQGVPRDGAVL